MRVLACRSGGRAVLGVRLSDDRIVDLSRAAPKLPRDLRSLLAGGPDALAAAGNADLTPLEILVLHNTNHRDREKRLTDICFLLNIEDTHTVNYALRKLLKSGLLEAEKRGKEVFYRTSASGAELIETYRAVRNTCLIDSMGRTDIKGDDLREIAAQLRAISGQYDQASRAAASL